ncbi:DUF4157 domain-containing protein [Trinickia sp. YCB016]
MSKALPQRRALTQETSSKERVPERVAQHRTDNDGIQSAQPAHLAPLQTDAMHYNSHGLPSRLRAGIEALSGMDMSDVVVHRNSGKPAQLNALAYARGNEIHLAPGQDEHLPHEAWHVVQQRQGRVRPSMQLAGVDVNDDVALEREADAMGSHAVLAAPSPAPSCAPEASTASSTPILQSVVQAGKPPGGGLMAMGSLHYSNGPHGRPAMPGSGVVQRVREVKDTEWERLDFIYEALDHYEDVLSYSSSIPPRLPPEFFPLYDEAERIYQTIYTSGEVENDETVSALERMVTALDEMMNAAKRRAAIDRAAQERAAYRPPSKTSRFMSDDLKTAAMERAEKLNAGMNAMPEFQRNLAVLRSNRDATFFVIGKSAMGQGDTAFVVRAVTMLSNLGLRAIGVKQEKDAYSGGTSFAKSIPFITPEQMRKHAKPGDFIIEGPLSDPVLPPPEPKTESKASKASSSSSPSPSSSITTTFDAMAGFTADKRTLRNLRLYEYGTLTYRGGQAVRAPHDKSNVVHHSGKLHHGFMGMGHGEMGAFYNASDTRISKPLNEVLAAFAETSLASKILLGLLAKHADAEIYIGYANQRTSVKSWVSTVSAIAAGRETFSIVIGLYGELKPAASGPIPQAEATWVWSKGEAFSGEKQRAETIPNKDSRVAVVIADGVPAPVMNALQKRAMPFTLSTGNYSLSEAVENRHFPIYETLDFNAGVQSAFQFQVLHALTKLGLEETDFGRAAIALTKAGPDSLPRMKAQIATVLAHPYEIRLVMGVIRANTDIKENFIARLASLV